jgi:ribonuclease P protein component
VQKSVSLKGKRCFSEVFNKGKRIRVKGLQCSVIRQCGGSEKPFCCATSGVTPYKIGIIISRRFGNACERNRAKRRLRAIIDRLSSEFAGHWCMTVRIFDEFKEIDFNDGISSFQDMCRKAGLFRETS